MRFQLNGTTVEYEGDPTARLLDVLREEYGLTGPKEGCGEGECGACSVLVNGRLTNSCVTAVGSMKDKEVLTLEGFKDTAQYKLLEKTYAEAGAVQCGFCTPGMIMAAQSLLLEKPQDRKSTRLNSSHL